MAGAHKTVLEIGKFINRDVEKAHVNGLAENYWVYGLKDDDYPVVIAVDPMALDMSTVTADPTVSPRTIKFVNTRYPPVLLAGNHRINAIKPYIERLTTAMLKLQEERTVRATGETYDGLRLG